MLSGDDDVITVNKERVTDRATCCSRQEAAKQESFQLEGEPVTHRRELVETHPLLIEEGVR